MVKSENSWALGKCQISSAAKEKMSASPPCDSLANDGRALGKNVTI